MQMVLPQWLHFNNVLIEFWLFPILLYYLAGILFWLWRESLNETENQVASPSTPNFLGKTDKKNIATVTIAQSPNEQKAKQFFSNIVNQVITALKAQAEKEKYSIEDLACTLATF
jgi:phosphate/sulfate permease